MIFHENRLLAMLIDDSHDISYLIRKMSQKGVVCSRDWRLMHMALRLTFYVCSASTVDKRLAEFENNPWSTTNQLHGYHV